MKVPLSRLWYLPRPQMEPCWNKVSKRKVLQFKPVRLKLHSQHSRLRLQLCSQPRQALKFPRFPLHRSLKRLLLRQVLPQLMRLHRWQMLSKRSHRLPSLAHLPKRRLRRSQRTRRISQKPRSQRTLTPCQTLLVRPNQLVQCLSLLRRN